MKTPEQKAARAQLVRNAIQRMAGRGEPVTGCGNTIARYLIDTVKSTPRRRSGVG